MRISLFCRLVNLRSARISESDRAGNLIESLSGRVIHRASDDLKLAVILYDHKVGMSAGHDLADKRRLQIRMLDKVRGNMSLDVMDRDQRFLCRIGDRLRSRNSDKKSTHKTRTVSHRDRRDLAQSHMRLIKGSLNHLVYLLNMLSRCDLRHYAAIERVERDLG